jgi:hypothetical protein
MGDELATILRLVAEGTLTPDEAAPLVAALTRGSEEAEPSVERRGSARGRHVRIQVSERGRRVIDVRVPLAFAAVAARSVPGIPDRFATLIEQAVESDAVGTIVDTEDEDGDGILISTE